MATNLTLGALSFAHWLGKQKRRKVPRRKTAEDLKVNERTVNNWAKGRTLPRAEDAARIEVLSEGAVPVSAWGERVGAKT